MPVEVRIRILNNYSYEERYYNAEGKLVELRKIYPALVRMVGNVFIPHNAWLRGKLVA